MGRSHRGFRACDEYCFPDDLADHQRDLKEHRQEHLFRRGDIEAVHHPHHIHRFELCCAKSTAHQDGAILELLPAKIEKIIVIIVSFISALVMFVLAYYSFRYMNELRIRETTTPALGAPYWYFIIIAPIMLFTSGIQFLRTVLKNFQEKDVWLSPEQQSEFEDEQTMIEGVLAEDDGTNWKLKETT